MAFSGVEITDTGTMGNVVEANFIGTDKTGTQALGNASGGVSILGGATGNTIGGVTADSGNLISGNLIDGVHIAGQGTSQNVLQGNFIGTDLSGTMAVENAEDGVRLDGGASQNTIGGTVAGAGNIIAFNSGNGVTIGTNASDGCTGDAIEGNSIFGNKGLGIDLGNDGVTPNDSQGHLSGPNLWQDFPILSYPDSSGTIIATLKSPPGTYRIEFFVNGNGSLDGGTQGATFLQSTNLTIGSSGTGSISYKPPAPIPTGGNITATATDANGNTSEFDRSYVLNFVTFQGNDFHPITSDVDPGLPTYADHQWQGGDDPHQWPVLYAAGGTLTVSADWTISTAPTSGSILAKGLATNDIEIQPTPVAQAGNELTLWAAQAASNPKPTLPTVATFYPDFAIAWQLSFDGGKTWVDAGQTDNPLYVSGAPNPQPDPWSKQFYLTVVDSEINQTHGMAATDKSTIVSATWDLFVGGAVRQFSPTEPFSDGTEYGRPLTYYGSPPSTGDPIKDTTQQLNPSAYTRSTTVGALLAEGDGQCAAWAGLFLDMLLVDGISETNDFVTIVPDHSSGFIVNNWNFLDAETSGFPGYPYVDKPALGSYEVVKGRGVDGENSLDPRLVLQ